MTFAPGTSLDRYTVEGILGQGGMALVYRVRHNQLGTTHALKVLHAPNPAVRERMLQEGRVQGQLRHPNIVPVTDLVDIAGAPGLVMEFVDGPSLDGLIERYKVTLEQADALAVGILDGVAHAHKQGFVHRDLKPANVLLDVTEQGLVPKVTDFGLAKMLSRDEDLGHTRSGMVMGTPAYMAPEQIRDSKNVDQRADVFSLGVILYELVSGDKPFQGDDIVALYTAITHGRYRPIQEVVPDLPDRMERAITGALVVDRNARIQDAERLLAIWRGDARPKKPVAPGPWQKEQLTGVTAVPELFVPGPAKPADEQITFHDDGPVLGSIPPRSHPILEDLGAIRIAPAKNVAVGSIDPSTALTDDGEVDFRRGPGAGAVVAVLLLLLVAGSGGAWYAGWLPVGALIEMLGTDADAGTPPEDGSEAPPAPGDGDGAKAAPAGAKDANGAGRKTPTGTAAAEPPPGAPAAAGTASESGEPAAAEAEAPTKASAAPAEAAPAEASTAPPKAAPETTEAEAAPVQEPAASGSAGGQEEAEIKVEDVRVAEPPEPASEPAPEPVPEEASPEAPAAEPEPRTIEVEYVPPSAPPPQDPPQ